MSHKPRDQKLSKSQKGERWTNSNYIKNPIANQIENHEIYDGKAEFPVADYAAGVYFVKVVTENSVRTIEFVKK